MKTAISKTIYSLLGVCLTVSISFGQMLERGSIEEFKIPKTACTVYAHTLENYLLGRGAFREKTDEHFYKLTRIDWAKSQLRLKEVKSDLTKNCTFFVEIKCSFDIMAPLCSDLGIIEVGYKSNEEAAAVCKEIEQMEFKFLNIELCYPPFKYFQKGKSVLFVYAANLDFVKYVDMVEDWMKNE